jgi:hypothetical protein
MRNYVHAGRHAGILKRRLRLSSATLAAMLLSALVASAAQAECPNEAVRQQQGSTALPDCRAYEMVSPAEKNGGDVAEGPGHTAASGDAVAYASEIPFAEPQAGALQNTYIAQRGADGWRTRSISPPQAPAYDVFIASSEFRIFSPDLSEGIVGNVDLNEPNELYDLSLQNTVSGSSRLLASIRDANGYVAGASTDLSHMVFETSDPLTPDSPTGVESNGYDATGGQLHLVTILPNGHPAPAGGVIGSGTLNFFGSSLHAISDDGTRIYFTAEGQLYVRIDNAETRQVSLPAPGVSDPAGTQHAVFQGASADGGVVFFTSTEKLTANATADAETGAADLYRYTLSSGELTDLSVQAGGGQVQGVLGMDGSGDHVYFVAYSQLVPGSGVAEAPNLYLWTPGAALAYVTTLSPADSELWTQHSQFYSPSPNEQVSEENGVLLMLSQGRLTSFENNEKAEAYLFDPASGLSCISCAAGGAPPAYGASFIGERFEMSKLTATDNLSANGSRAFFVTREALVPQDTNGQRDVYEWTAGAVHLISTGQDDSESEFASASPDGSNVFFTTHQRLAPQDIDTNTDLYDARVDGGFLQPRPAACTGTGCQGVPPAPPIFATPSSTTYNGVGNFAPAPKAVSVKTKKKPKPKPKKKKAKKSPAKGKPAKGKVRAKGKGRGNAQQQRAAAKRGSARKARKANRHAATRGR